AFGRRRRARPRRGGSATCNASAFLVVGDAFRSLRRNDAPERAVSTPSGSGAPSGARQLPDRPHLHRATGGGGAAGRPGDGLVEVSRLDQIVAGQLLLAVGVGAVEH